MIRRGRARQRATGSRSPWSALPFVGCAAVAVAAATMSPPTGTPFALQVFLLASLPVLWAALHGSRLHVLLVAAASSVLLVAPLTVLRGVAWDVADWGVLASWVCLAFVLCPGIQLVVDRVWRHDHAQVSEAARQSLGRVRTLSDQVDQLVLQAPTGICVVGLDGVVERVNPALVTMLGRPEDPTGASVALLGLLPGADGPEVVRSVLSADGATVTREVRIGGDADPHHLSVHATTLTDEDGEPSGVLVHLFDVTARTRVEARLDHLSSHDGLTGLANRSTFDGVLEEHLVRCRRYGPAGAVLMTDLDHFKDVNDSLGHDAGDRLLVEVAAVLQGTLRESDVVARLGGDEFVVLLPRADRAEATVVAQRLVEAVRSMEPPEGYRGQPVTASVGAVVLDEVGVSASELISTADLTMYDAKEAGRDRAAVFDATEYALPQSGARLVWASRVREALRDDGFELHAQPLVDLGTREVVGAELLLRMVDRDGSLVAPVHFLPVAERTGLIPQVDRWVVKRGLERLAELAEVGSTVGLSVNISGRSLDDTDFACEIAAAVQASSVDPSRLTFEITETAAIADMERARTFTQMLHDLGCRLALDDFGAGYGSFYYLKHLPFDYVKIDGEFVRGALADPVDRLVVASVVSLAQGVDGHVVAEHVADEETAVLLRDLGVDLGQGVYLGPPRPWSTFVAELGGAAVEPVPADLA
ncbi:MAG: EAL domain-containing protein [Nocardioidaceae bacterium]|nr:EAL domain-containing protein [Nocardioidaceae bacterium]